MMDHPLQVAGVVSEARRKREKERKRTPKSSSLSAPGPNPCYSSDRRLLLSILLLDRLYRRRRSCEKGVESVRGKRESGVARKKGRTGERSWESASVGS
jgi:hypothetical protein